MSYAVSGYWVPGYSVGDEDEVVDVPRGIASEIQRLAPGSIVELFEVDATSLGGDALRFHAGTNELLQPVVWQGSTYQPFPVEASGFEVSGRGQLPRPVLRVANVTGLLGAAVREYQDLLGCRVTRKRTMARYLDAANFPGGVNDSADPDAHLPDDIYIIDRKSVENELLVEFELAATFDVAGVKLPRRTVVQNSCPWTYRLADRSSGCTWSGTTYFDAADNPVTSSALDACGKRLSSCQARFGAAALPFGGFPAAGLTR